MGRRPGLLSPVRLAGCLHQVLTEAGIRDGQRIPRKKWDDIVIVAFEVAARNSIIAYTRAGEAKGLWTVTEAHGKGGRGYVTIHAS